MKILITGATGFIGTKLTKKLVESGHEIHVLTRDSNRAKAHFPEHRVTAFEWHDNLSEPPAAAVQGIDGVINLMGENIGGKRWSDDQKKKLRESRVDATKNLISLIERERSTPLDFFISASAIGIYPVNLPGPLNEESAEGHTYLARLCHDWEQPLTLLNKTKRKVIVRTGVVFGENGGALQKMLPPFKMGLGGPIGDGNQMMSWIHLDDIVALYMKAATDESMSGIYNACAPTPVCNFDFTKALGDALHRPTLFPVPTLPLKLAFGEMSTVILDSQTVVSKRLGEAGFEFKYPTIDSALKAIFGKSEEKKQRRHNEKKPLLDQA